MNPIGIFAVAACLGFARLCADALLVGGDPAPLLCRSDCGWYSAIAEHGYLIPAHIAVTGLQHAWPFFPLLPLLLAAVRRLTSLPTPDAATLLVTACTVASAAVGVRYRAMTRDRARASTWLIFSFAMPFGVYFTTGYTEPLYLLLSLAALLEMAAGRPFRASIPAALLAVSRPTGIWLAPAIGVAALRRAFAARTAAAAAIALTPCLIAISGLLAWIGYCTVFAGDPLVFVHAQAAWGRHAADPLTVLANALREAAEHHRLRAFVYEAGWAAVGLAVAVIAFRMRRWAEAFFLAATVLLALSSGSLGSMGRFVSANPVVLLFAADLIDRIDSRIGRAACLLACAALQLLITQLWLDGWEALV